MLTSLYVLYGRHTNVLSMINLVRVVGMYYLKSSCGIKRIDRIRNEVTRNLGCGKKFM